MNALREVNTLITTYGVDDAVLGSLRDSKVAARVADQLLDLRSEITKEASAAVMSLTEQASHLAAFPALVVEVLSGPLLKLVAVPHKVMSDQGHAAASCVFAVAQSHRVLARLSETQTDRRAPVNLRARCAEYLRTALATWSEEVLSREPDTLEVAILAGVGDASPDVRCLEPLSLAHLALTLTHVRAPSLQVRRASKASFELFRELFPPRAARLLSRMDAAGACVTGYEVLSPPPKKAEGFTCAPLPLTLRRPEVDQQRRA